jgi:hypothetical protein
VTVSGTKNTLSGAPSSHSEPVRPKEVAPLKPVSTTTTTIKPAPLNPTTTTLQPAPLQPTTTTTTAPATLDFTQEVVKQSGATALASFTPNGPISLVDLHYKVKGTQQDLRMEAKAGHYEALMTNLAAGDVVTYWFTYLPANSTVDIRSKDFSYAQG